MAARGPFARAGPRSRSSRRRPGTRTPSSGSSSTGGSTRCRPSATSGTRGTCTRATRRSSRTTSRPTVRRRRFGYKDFIPHVHGREVRRPRAGPRSSRPRGPATSCPWPSTTTASPCTTARSPSGPRRRWAPARHRGRAGRGDPRRGPGLRPVLAPGGALVVLRPGDDLRLGRAGSAIRRPLRPGRDQKKAEDKSEPPDQAFLDDWLARTAELVDKYKPQLVWFDWWIAQPAVHPNLQTFAAFYYNRGEEWGKGVAINYKKHGGESFPDTAGVLDIERGQLAAIRPIFWQTDTSVSKTSWGYVGQPRVQDGGLHRGRPRRHREQERQPAPEHRPEARRHPPRARGGASCGSIGQWLAVNGEAIYGTRPFTRLRRRADRGRRGTLRRREAQGLHRRGRALHHPRRAPLRHRPRTLSPADGRLRIRSLARGSVHLAGPIQSVDLLGSSESLQWAQDASGLRVELPGKSPLPFALALRIALR